MDYFSVAAVMWLALFVVLGAFKGLWKALAAAISLVAAYYASVQFAPGLTDFFQRHFAGAQFNESVVWFVCATLLFIVVGFLVRLLILLIAKPIPITSPIANRLGGAVISGAYGAILGAVTIWGLAFLADTWNMRQQQNGHAAASSNQSPLIFDTSSPVVGWSRYWMSRWIHWNVQQSGGSESVASISAAMAERPAEVMADVQATVRSPEFRQMVKSEKIQQMVRQRDAEALQQTPEFVQLLRQPAVRELRRMVAPHASAWSDQQIAEELVDIWSEVDQFQSRPEVAAMMADPEVKNFLAGEGKVTPSLLRKGQQLLALLGSQAPSTHSKAPLDRQVPLDNRVPFDNQIPEPDQTGISEVDSPL